MTVQIPQTSVSTTISAPYAGLVSDVGNKHIASGVSAEASAEIPFGVAVLRDATNKDTGRVLPHTSAAVSAARFAGVIAHSHAYAKDSELGTVGLKPKTTLQVMERGRIWVLPEEAVTPGDAVRFRAVATGGEQAGRFRTTADATDCVNISSFARWVTSGNSTTPAELEFDIVNAALATADT